MKFIIKSCTTNPGGGIPDWWCKIPFWRCSQLQVEEILFMADRNLEARRRRHLSICQMMATLQDKLPLCTVDRDQ